MVFSSIPFLYYFLPAVLLLYFIAPRKIKNYVLLAFSLFFYFYGEKKLVFLMVFTAMWDYLCSLSIDFFRRRNNKIMPKVSLVLSLLVDLGLLCYFKYTDFFISNINAIVGTNIPLLKVALPIGISFYTFQSLSYTIDVYRGKVPVQKNPFTYATYLTLFPQLVAGPIVRYSTVVDELDNRKHSFEKFSQGAFRFCVGLAKKVLIANVIGEFCSKFSAIGEKTVVLYWFYAIAYSLQIYFDFSGYSDMAIGLGKIFGFEFCENFNYPYISKTISEFWRLWHMSLGSWFRDYIYIPLGGNRVKFGRWIFNIFVVWFVTGFWHGAGWNFIVWGLFFGVLLVLEKLFLKKWLDKIPAVFSHIYVLLAVMISFVIFSSKDNLGGFSQGLQHIGAMFGGAGVKFCSSETLYYLRDYAVVLLAGIVGSTPLMKNTAKKLCEKWKPIEYAAPFIVAGILIICTGELVDSTFNPFLYFNF